MEASKMPRKYIDDRGWKYQVMPGLGSGSFKARYQRADRQGGDGWKGVASLPWRNNARDAQADLDQLAAKKGWKEWNG